MTSPKCSVCAAPAVNHAWWPRGEGKYAFLWLCACHMESMTKPGEVT
jgi:hypothetical protein